MQLDPASFFIGIVAGIAGGVVAIFLSRADYWTIRHRQYDLAYATVDQMKKDIEALQKEKELLREIDEREDQEIKLLREQNRREEEELVNLTSTVDKQRKEIKKLSDEVLKLRNVMVQRRGNSSKTH